MRPTITPSLSTSLIVLVPANRRALDEDQRGHGISGAARPATSAELSGTSRYFGGRTVIAAAGQRKGHPGAWPDGLSDELPVFPRFRSLSVES
jgi:hypothetical protein